MSKNRLLASLEELKNLRSLTLCALLIALHVLLNMFSFYIVGQIKVSFAYLALAVIAMLFGPVTAAFAGGISEFVGYLFNSAAGAYHPGFTLTTMLAGFVMGLFFYRRDIKLWRIISARLCVNLLLNIGINTIWVMQMVGKAYLVLLPPRTWKNLVLLPVEVFLIFAVFKTVQAVERRYALGRSAGK